MWQSKQVTVGLALKLHSPDTSEFSSYRTSDGGPLMNKHLSEGFSHRDQKKKLRSEGDDTAQNLKDKWEEDAFISFSKYQENVFSSQV